MPGKITWLVASVGSIRYFFGRAFIQAVAEANHPPDTLIVFVDRLRSCRFLPGKIEDRGQWRLTVEVPVVQGVQACPPILATRFAAMFHLNKVSRMYPTPVKGIDQPVGNSRGAVRRRFAWLLRLYAFGDLQGDDRCRDLSPFAAALRAAGDDSDMFVEELRRLDTTLLAGVHSSFGDASPVESLAVAAPIVDLFMAQFNPATAVIRRFLAGPVRSDPSEALAKTQRAEAAHQALVLDLASFLTACGYLPLQSRSVDLALDLSGEHVLFEIKSADSYNVISQAEAGLLQLLRYRAAARGEDMPVAGSIVVIGFIPISAIQAYLRELGSEAEVTFLFYDLAASSKPHP